MAFQLWSLLYFILKCSQCSRNLNQPCWITRALLPAPLWVSCCSTAVSRLPKAHLLPTAPAAAHKLIPGTRWELAPAPCNCCFRASGEASVLAPPPSLAGRLLWPTFREKSQGWQVRILIHFACCQQLKIPASLIFVSWWTTAASAVIYMELSGWDIASYHRLFEKSEQLYWSQHFL